MYRLFKSRAGEGFVETAVEIFKPMQVSIEKVER